MPEQTLNFADDQKNGSKEAWTMLVEKTLRGKPFDKAMVKTGHDGLTIEALSTQEDHSNANQPTKVHGDWKIVSPNWDNDADSVNADIMEDLERGASAIAVTVPEHAEGDWLNTAFKGVYFNMVPFILIQGGDFASGASGMLQLLGESGYEPSDISGTLGIDPIGALARAGHLSTSAEDAIASACEIASGSIEKYPNIAPFVADGTVYANAGAPAALELAAPLSAAVTYLRAMEKQGLPIEAAAKGIQFTLSASANIWSTIAKFRTLRRVWNSILNACGVVGVDAHINAVSAIYMTTRNDPWVNILRGTSACFAAGVGGADTVTTLPHDLMLGTSDAFSRRIARNIQVTLLEESNLAKVVDPAAGSFSLEKMTDDLTAQTQSAFKEMEASGGVLECLRSGALQALIGNAEKERREKIRKRKMAITGVSEFPNIEETVALPEYEGSSGKGSIEFGETIAPLTLNLLAAEFEALRVRSEKIRQQSGQRPSIFLANIGSTADYTARATFAKNFFEAGGVKAVSGSGSTVAADIAQEYTASGALLSVVCSSDQMYGAHAADVVSQLRGAGSAKVYLAGRSNDEHVLMAAGLSEMIFLGCDVVETLDRALDVYADKLGEGA